MPKVTIRAGGVIRSNIPRDLKSGVVRAGQKLDATAADLKVMDTWGISYTRDDGEPTPHFPKDPDMDKLVAAKAPKSRPVRDVAASDLE